MTRYTIDCREMPSDSNCTDSRPADAAVIKQGEVCKRNNDHCITIGPGDSVPFTVKSYTFIAPTAGTALVSFHGTMQCVNDASVDDTLHGIIVSPRKS